MNQYQYIPPCNKIDLYMPNINWITLMETARWVLKDGIVLPVFELTLFIVFLYSFYKEVSRRGSGLVVKRGQEGWAYFGLVYGIVSLILIEIINSSSALMEYKVILILLNLSIALYLCFFNSWFRNKIVGFIERSKNKAENL